jgi:hypothetical protein
MNLPTTIPVMFQEWVWSAVVVDSAGRDRVVRGNVTVNTDVESTHHEIERAILGVLYSDPKNKIRGVNQLAWMQKEAA